MFVRDEPPPRGAAFLHAAGAFLFPPRCCVCRSLLREGVGLFCPVCTRTFRRIETPMCPVCGMPYRARTGVDHPCPECTDHAPPFEQARSVFLYEGALRKAIHRFKYERKPGLARGLGALLADFCGGWADDLPWDVVVPVPLYVSKIRKRGFNQALLLSRRIARRTGSSLCVDLLQRTRMTRPQVELSGQERRNNVRNAFSIKQRGECTKKRVLLVDDVITTGATVRECARILRRSGAASVHVIALARSVEWQWVEP